MKWEKGEGDKLEEGDIIAQVETDKATMDMETPAEGYLARIIVPAGSKDLPLGKVRKLYENVPNFYVHVCVHCISLVIGNYC